MIGVEVHNLTMRYRESKKTAVFEDLNFKLEHDSRLALLGRNGQGKSTLIKLLGGVLQPTSGQIDWHIRSSWPIGFGGGFQGSLTGRDNIKFLSRIYDVDFEEILDTVEAFAELGAALNRPVKQYSSGMRARLAFGLSLAIDFDCYMIDEIVAVGDARFQLKCREELFEKRSQNSYIMASHDLSLVQETCDTAIILESGKVKIYSDIEEAIDVYQWLRAL